MDSIFRHLIQNMSQGYSYNKLVFDENNNPIDYFVLDVNSSFLKLIGLSRTQIVGKKMHEVFPHLFNESREWLNTYLEVSKTGKSIYFESFSNILNKWLRITVYSSEQNCFASIFEDITYRKICESETNYLKNFYETVLDGIINGVWVCDKNDYIYYVNNGMTKISGFSANELKGKNILTDFNESLKYFKDYFINAKKSFFPFYYDAVPVTTQLGKFSYHSGWLIPIINDGFYKGMICTVDDITDKKILEDARLKLLNENEIKNKELENILFITSHDLRTPLLNIHGYCDEMKNSVLEIKESIDKSSSLDDNLKVNIDKIYTEDISLFMQYINMSVKKMDQLLNSLLKISRTVKDTIILEAIDMNKLVDEIFRSMESLTHEKNIRLERDLLHDTHGDKKQLNLVISVLIDNAIKYIGNKDNAKVHIFSFIKENDIVYCVEDNGSGIPEKLHDKIFQIFYSMSPKDKENSEGIGLTLAKRLVGRHGGSMWVESIVGEGSKFYFSIPKSDISE